jgi:hypothetical protein
LKLVLDEPRQPVAVAEARGLGPEGLEVVTHHGVQHRRAEVPWSMFG